MAFLLILSEKAMMIILQSDRRLFFVLIDDLINDKVIDFEDLVGFSPELIEVVHHFVRR